MDGSPALLILASAALAALAMLSFAGLRAWRGWLELRRTQIEAGSSARVSGGKVDIASLRERVRRLEAIANG